MTRLAMTLRGLTVPKLGYQSVTEIGRAHV